MKIRLIARIVATTFLTLGLGAATVPCLSAMSADNTHNISRMLSELSSEAYFLNHATEQMGALTDNNNISWRSHSDAIDAIRDDINSMGRDLEKLDQGRAVALPWQIRALDCAEPVLRDLAANTDAVIEDLNSDPQLRNTDNYKNYIRKNAEDASDLAASLSDFVKYGKTEERLTRLTERLRVEPPQSTGAAQSMLPR